MERRRFLCYAGCLGVASITGCAVGRASRKEAELSGQTESIRAEDLTYCGLDCTACDVYKATVNGDQEARMRAVKSWTPVAQEHWGLEKFGPAIIDCDGCRTPGPKFRGHGWCPTRACAQERDLSICGLCPEWRECGRVAESLGDSCEARANLEAISQNFSRGVVRDSQ